MSPHLISLSSLSTLPITASSATAYSATLADTCHRQLILIVSNLSYLSSDGTKIISECTLFQRTMSLHLSLHVRGIIVLYMLRALLPWYTHPAYIKHPCERDHFNLSYYGRVFDLQSQSISLGVILFLGLGSLCLFLCL